MSLNRSKRRKVDPTGQHSRRQKATRALNSRLRRSERQIKTLFNGIPTTRRTVTPLPNQTTVVYDYDISPAQSAQLEMEIRAVLNDEFGTQGDTPGPGWFWASEIEPPYRQGTVEEVNKVNQLIVAAILAGLITDPFVRQIPDDVILQSTEYQATLRGAVVRNYGMIKSLSDRTSAQVIQEINSGVSGGFSPTDISKNISNRFKVSKSNAKRIADTEINRAYNDSKLKAAKTIETRTGQRTCVLHISALLPVTRDTHADRHGKAYTVEDQQKWWDTGVNRINCKCSTSTALIQDDGTLMQTEDQETLKAERDFFER